MTIEERHNKAISAFFNGYNCAQSVMVAFPEVLKQDTDGALRQASSFGGGMGRLQLTCGALTGAFMIIGRAKGHSQTTEEEKKETLAKLIRKAATMFNNTHKTLNCSELLGIDLNTPEGKEEHRTGPLKEKVCTACIRDAITITAELTEL